MLDGRSRAPAGKIAALGGLGGVTVTGGTPAHMYCGAKADVGLSFSCSGAGVGPAVASADESACLSIGIAFEQASQLETAAGFCRLSVN